VHAEAIAKIATAAARHDERQNLTLASPGSRFEPPFNY